MLISDRWQIAALLAGALLAGTIIGPPLAQAVATATGLVRIEGGGSTAVAKVSKSGQLSVNTGLATTPTGQLQIAQASPASVVTVFGRPTCSSGGFYAPPAGKALIITAVNFYDWESASPGTPHQLVLYAGPHANPCNSVSDTGVLAGGPADGDATYNQVFPSGIAIPAGDALGLFSFNDKGSAEVYGYLVPASAVPASALRNS